MSDFIPGDLWGIISSSSELLDLHWKWMILEKSVLNDVFLLSSFLLLANLNLFGDELVARGH